MRKICIIKKKNGVNRVILKGTTIDGLIASTALCNTIADLLVREINISKEQAINFICDSIKEAYDSLK